MNLDDMIINGETYAEIEKTLKVSSKTISARKKQLISEGLIIPKERKVKKESKKVSHNDNEKFQKLTSYPLPYVSYSIVCELMEFWSELEKRRYLTKVKRKRYLDIVLQLNGVVVK